MNDRIRIRIKAHWVNSWFLKLVSKPVAVVGRAEHPLVWSKPTGIEIEQVTSARIGVGVRYFGRGKLLGLSMTELPAHSTLELRSGVITFRNGFWNHEPFKLVGLFPVVTGGTKQIELARQGPHPQERGCEHRNRRGKRTGSEDPHRRGYTEPVAEEPGE